jgi:hypothetical protein
MAAPIRAVALSGPRIAVATDSVITTIERTVDGTLVLVDSQELCGTPTAVAFGGNGLLVDTSIGLETYALDGLALAAGPIDSIPGPSSGTPGSPPRGVSLPSGISRHACRAMQASLCRGLAGACTDHHAFAVDSDGVAWVARDNAIYAVDASAVRGRVLDRHLVGDSAVAIRALHDRLAVIGSASGMPDREILDLSRASGTSTIVATGTHNLSSWVTSAPIETSGWLIHLAGNRLEAVRALTP